MIELYCKLIISGRRTFSQIPDDVKEEVEYRLASRGFDTNGDPIEVGVSV